MSDEKVVAGYVVAGRYRLESQLGQGGMGSVWRAEDLSLGSPVALKVLDPDLAADQGIQERFYHEAKAAAALRSPHVVHIIEYGVDDGLPFITMELLEGETLADRLVRVNILPHGETARILSDVARAVRKAHEAGIVHRDLKPENIFLVRNDDQEIAKVLDFGIAKADPAIGGPSRTTKTGVLIGTPPYMSPEQARGAKVDHRTDLWALGVIAFECVCGRLPFLAENPGELVLQICSEPIPVPSEVADVPPGFDAWFAQATSRNPGQRFQSAKDMIDALRVVLTPAVPLQAAPASVSTPTLDVFRPAAPRAETMSGGANFVSGLQVPGRARATVRAGVIGGAAGAVVLAVAVVWQVLSPHESATDPVSSSAAPGDPAAMAPADRLAPGSAPADRLAPGSAPPAATTTGPVVAPAEAPPPAPASPPGPALAKGASPAAPKDPVKPAAKTELPKAPETAEPAKAAILQGKMAGEKPSSPPGAHPPDKKKPEDRIGF
jgi:serine/threonine-protein kinase